MNFDVRGNLDAVDRSVSSLERDGSPARAVMLSRGFETAIEELWDAVTNGDRIPRWFLPVTGDLRLGGHYQLEGNAGGKIIECEPLSQFSLTWEFASDISWLDVCFSNDGDGRSRLKLTHTAHLSEQWDEYGPGAVGVGWDSGLLGLAFHLANPSWPKPDAAEFVVSPDGRAYISGSSDAWRQAAVASGTSPSDAEAAAKRTTAFYTGEPTEHP